jgi:16S rRNA pseudouridine516 synthase
MSQIQRIDKILGHLGYGTRKEIKEMIKKGRVYIGQQKVKDAGIRISPEIDDIYIDGEKVVYIKNIYVMMNKPQGVISATEDSCHKTVIDILPSEFRLKNIFPVGRLDIDTEGLMILTNDGQLAHRILSPKKHIPKTYYAKIEGIVTEKDNESFRNGITLDDGYHCLPADLKILKSYEVSEILVKIYEGKFHQVKRMFEAVNKKVIYLKRMQMGELKLDETLKLGQSRELTKEELALLTMTEE